MRALNDFEKKVLYFMIEPNKEEIRPEFVEISKARTNYCAIQRHFIEGKNIEIRYYIDLKKVIVHEHQDENSYEKTVWSNLAFQFQITSGLSELLIYLNDNNYIYFQKTNLPGLTMDNNGESYFSVEDNDVHKLNIVGEDEYKKEWMKRNPGVEKIMHTNSEIPVNESVFKLLDRFIIITEELKNYVNNGFMTKDEKAQKEESRKRDKQFILSLMIAVVFSSISLFISLGTLSFTKKQQQKPMSVKLDENQIEMILKEVNDTKGLTKEELFNAIDTLKSIE